MLCKFVSHTVGCIKETGNISVLKKLIKKIIWHSFLSTILTYLILFKKITKKSDLKKKYLQNLIRIHF